MTITVSEEVARWARRKAVGLSQCGHGAFVAKGTVKFDGKEYDAEQFFSNASNVFVFMVANHAEPSAFEGLDAKVIPHPTDS